MSVTTTPDQPVVQLTGLGKCYAGTWVVQALDLSVAPGECLGVLGPNGAGKSTTLRMILGLTPQDAGQIEVLGLPIPAMAQQVRARVGVVPQFDTLDPDFTVEENLRTYASYFGLRGAALEARLQPLLEAVHLADRRTASIQSLSGGMKRRLTLARALVNQPDLVVLDEPTTGLDPQARRHLWQQLRDLRRQGVTIILTTHYMEEAETLCDRIAIIDHGRLIACATPQALIAQHSEPWVIALDTSVLSRLPVAEQRVHRSGDVSLVYVQDIQRWTQHLEAEHIAFSSRPGNLEDVFLRLTGHDLRD